MGKRNIIENGTRFGNSLVICDAGVINRNSMSWVVVEV